MAFIMFADIMVTFDEKTDANLSKF